MDMGSVPEDVRRDFELAREASRLTIGSLFRQTARSWPDRVSLQAGDIQVTYAELDQRTDRLCNYLKGRGVLRGDRIAILSENRFEYVELLIAAAKMGVIAACQNWRLSDDELHHCLELVGPKLLFTSPLHQGAAARCDHIAPSLMFGPDYEAALDAALQVPVEGDCDSEDGVVILYTSGTTGMPKGALISQRAEIARAMIQMTDTPTAASDAFVAWAPLFHMASVDAVFMKLIQGGKVILTAGFDGAELASIVSRERLGWLVLMPGMITPFIAAMEASGASVAGVKWTGAMADLVPREQIAAVTRLLGAPYLNSFGSTETGLAPASRGIIEVGVVPEKLDKLRSSFCSIRLVGSDDVEVPNGEPGELAIRSPALFSGYWNNPDANQKDFRGGWFHMGDVFSRNPNGTLSFVDRSKYLIKSGGENIYPAEIERVLMAEPMVAEAAVVRKVDPRWGEVPVAFVVRRDESLTADALQARCAAQIARYKLPKEIHFVDEAELPRSTTGKIKRHDLEQRIAGKL